MSEAPRPFPHFLYHGTSERAVEAILSEGITPRGDDRPSSWGAVPSARDRVYLAEGYAPYFAGAAAQEGERHALVEVSLATLDERLLRPDEDFIAQALRQQDARLRKLPWSELNHLVLCSGKWDGYWRESLKAMGTCAFAGVIPPAAIRRVALYDPARNPRMALEATDPAISVVNWQFCAEKYRVLTRWWIGDAVSLEEWLRAQVGGGAMLSRQQKAQIATMLGNQPVEVRNNPAAVNAPAQDNAAQAAVKD